jgi:general secretion pathway protein K
MRRQQQGAALLTALLVTAIATVIAVSMASRQQIDIRRTGNVLEADQGYLFALGVEDWAKQILAKDRKDNEVDNLGEDWATILPPLTVEGAMVAGQINDLQGLFNINNLLNEDGKVSAPDVKRFQRLLEAVALDPELANAVVDWIDEDEDTTFPGGAEDQEYLGLDIPYRTANAPMASTSELALIKGIGIEGYQALAPYVTALPGRTAINVNTAPAQVMMALVEGLGETEAEQIVEDRGDSGYNGLTDFLALPEVKDHPPEDKSIGLASEYFLIAAVTQFGNSKVQLYSMVSRNGSAKVEVIMRGQGVF